MYICVRMEKILHVYPQLNCGGTEMVIYNLIKYSNNAEFHYDILVQKKGEMDLAFEGLGCRIIVVSKECRKSYEFQLRDFFVEYHYDVVHTHMHEEIPIVLKVAKETGIRHRIVHSHNARIDIPRFLWPFRFFKHYKYERNATHLLGCSELALKWFFPTRWRKGMIVYNGIDLDAFQFNQQVREEYRKRLGVKDNTILAVTVGRCTEQKNQHFIIDRAKELIEEDILFLIIGEGPLFSALQERVEKENVTNVRLLGKQFDIPNWLSAADIFVFPSIYEGLGIVAIEAQTAGLKVYSTPQIPKEVDMGLGLLNRIPLSDTQSWNKMMLMSDASACTREEKSSLAYSSLYNIREVVKSVEKIYSEKC